jgi:CRP-like cAMP-binding protein
MAAIPCDPDAEGWQPLARTATNSILDRIPASKRNELLAQMEPVELQVGKVVIRPGEPSEFAHFVTSGIVSVVIYMKEGAAAEVGLIGKEGVVEAMQLLGKADSPTISFVQVAGHALRMPFADFEKEAFAYKPLMSAVLDFVQRHNFALTQLAACNGLHEIEERLARWLLMVQDRVDSPNFNLTQEFLAGMLGTRRTSVTLAAGSLQRSGLIEYRRGRIRILDRKKLEAAACECFPIVHGLLDEYSR